MTARAVLTKAELRRRCEAQWNSGAARVDILPDGTVRGYANDNTPANLPADAAPTDVDWSDRKL